MSRRWIVVSLIFLGILINYVDRGNLSIAAPSMMRDFHMSPATMGVLLSAFFWTYCVCQIPAGAIVDRFGIRRTYAAGFFLWSIASAAIALCQGPGEVVGLRLVLGFAESTAPLASLAFIQSNFSGKEQGLPTAIYIAGQNVGPALGVLIGALLLSAYGWRVMFALTGLAALLWLPGWLSAAPRDETVRVRPVPKPVEDRAGPPSWTWREVASTRTFWAMSLAILLSSYYWYFVLTWIPSYLILSRGFSTVKMGKVLSVALFTMAGVNIVAGSAADKLAGRIGVFQSRLWFGILGYAGTASILLLLLPIGRAWLLPILTFSVCATGIGNANYWTIAQYVPTKRLVGRTIGYLNTIAVIGGIAAPLVTGWTLGPHKQFGTAIVIAGVCPVVAALCLLVAGPGGLSRMKTLLASTTAQGAESVV